MRHTSDSALYLKASKGGKGKYEFLSYKEEKIAKDFPKPHH